VPVPSPSRLKRAPLRVVRVVGGAGAVIDPAVEAEVDRAAACLRDAGYEIVETATPSLAEASDLWGQILGTELLRFAIPAFEDQMEASCRQSIRAMLELWQPDERVDSYIAAWVARRRLVRETAVWMEQHPLVLSPIAGMATPPLDFDHFLSVERTRELVNRMRNTLWPPLLGLPAVALPNGVQIVGRRFHDHEALAAGLVVARALGPVTVATPATDLALDMGRVTA
jgi:amidase